MSNVLFISFFNSTNIGDRAICRSIQCSIKKFANITTMDISGRAVKKKADILSPGTTNKRCRLYNIKCILSLLKKNRFEYAKKQINDNDVTLIAGGNLIMDLEVFPFYSYLCYTYARYARRKGKKLIIAFVGNGIIRNIVQKWLWKRTINMANYVTVRDSKTKCFLKNDLKCKNDVFVWEDPAFGIEALDNEKEYDHILGINVFIGAVPRQEECRLTKGYVQLINTLKDRFKIILFSTEINDNEGLKHIYNAIENKQNIKMALPKDLRELLELYKTVDIVLAMRMHAYIIAVTQNIPSLIIDWSSKIAGLVADQELNSICFSINEICDDHECVIRELNKIDQEYTLFKNGIIENNTIIKNKLAQHYCILERMIR